MAYATSQQMIDRFGEEELIHLTDRSNTEEMIVVDVLDAAIADAEGEVNAYLGVRYALPLPVVSRDIVRVACDITRYRLYEEGAPDTVRRRYEDAIRFLKEVAAGRATVVNDDGTALNKPADELSQYGAGDKIVAFGQSFVQAYKVGHGDI